MYFRVYLHLCIYSTEPNSPPQALSDSAVYVIIS
jgi:hypothetical protein